MYVQNGHFHLLVLVIKDVHLKVTWRNMARVIVGCQGFSRWDPEIKLCQPVMQCVHLKQLMEGKNKGAGWWNGKKYAKKGMTE